jgi:putative tricarboxylic transport membrane protein
VLLAVRSYPNLSGQPVGPALFPSLIAYGLCAGGALLVWQGWRYRADGPWLEWEDWVRSPRHTKALVALLGSVVFYILVSDTLGFLITALVMMMTLFRSLHVAWGRSVLWAVVATVVVHFAFYKLLRVPLPWGVLTPLAW